jgi:hypothetical protein
VGANLASIMEGLSPVDAELGSVVSLGYDQNGERDIVTYLQHVRPRFFIPNHMTAVAVEGSSLEWKAGFLDALNAANVPRPRGLIYGGWLTQTTISSRLCSIRRINCRVHSEAKCDN